MTEKTLEMPWKKSAQWRSFSSTSQIVQTGNLGGGTKVLVRFANTAIDVDKEVIPGEDIENGFRVKGSSTFQLGQPYKVEEALIELTPNGAKSLIVALSGHAAVFTPKAQQEIRDAIAKMPAPLQAPAKKPEQ